MVTISRNQVLSDRGLRLVKYAKIAATLALAISIGFLVVAVPYLFVFQVSLVDSFIVDSFIVDNFIKEYVLPEAASFDFSLVTRLLGVFLLSCSDFLGIVGFYYARKLLVGYGKGEVFTMRAAKTISRIGWIVVSIAIVSPLTNLLGVSIFGMLATPSSLIISVKLENTDVYAIVFGLLIVVIGHVMYEAVRISDENREIV